MNDKQLNSVFNKVNEITNQIENTQEFWIEFKKQYDEVIELDELFSKFNIQPCCINLRKVINESTTVDGTSGKRKRSASKSESKAKKRFRKN